MLDTDIVFNYMDNNGVLHEYNIIARFNKNNKNYMIYSETGSEEIYADLYEVIDNKIKIIPISNEEDYSVVDDYLESL